MLVKVLYFAVLRERLGKEEEDWEVVEGLTISDLLHQIEQRYPHIAPLLPRLSVAVNRAVVARADMLHEGDEVALLPPVSGGMDPRRVAVLDQPLSLDEVVAAVEAPSQGALVTFIGVVRNHGQQAEVARLEYEAFVPMAVQVIEELIGEVQSEWPQSRAAVHHRVGHLNVGERAVVIAVSAPHRGEAFDACRAVIDRLKQRVPIWKKEVGSDGSEWIGLGP